jgi:DNA-binding Xre family transcriptional regulator
MQQTKENEEKFHRSRNGLRKEFWEPIEFDFEITNESRWEISNWGRVRSFNKTSDGNLLKGSLIEGYRVIKLKLYKPRDNKTQKKFDDLQKQKTNLYVQRRMQINKRDLANNIALTTQQIEKKKKELSQQLAGNLKQRTINYHFLIHRKVAEHFLSIPKPEQTIVGHLDFDKLNNRATNLRWMTPEDNKTHQTNSPYVVAEKRQRKQGRAESSKASKLTVTKIMLIKKILKERSTTLKKLAKQFKVSDMQIHRIKTGENWGYIKAAN